MASRCGSLLVVVSL